tara:strand:- start:151 stop:288 length:138 start_codon:yes stop_codon:yes gene_type:complete
MKKMSKEDIEYRQGRSEKQYEASAIGAFYSLLGMFVLAIIYLISK